MVERVGGVGGVGVFVRRGEGPVEGASHSDRKHYHDTKGDNPYKTHKPLNLLNRQRSGGWGRCGRVQGQEAVCFDISRLMLRALHAAIELGPVTLVVKFLLGTLPISPETPLSYKPP